MDLNVLPFFVHTVILYPDYLDLQLKSEEISVSCPRI